MSPVRPSPGLADWVISTLSFDMGNRTEPGEKTVDEHRAAFARSGKPGHLNLLVSS